MSNPDIVRAWRDPSYRRSLTHEEASQVPAHPAGLAGVAEEELRAAGGIDETAVTTTAWFCTLYTFLARCCN